MSDHIPDPVEMVSARDKAVERALMAAWCAPIKGVTDEDAFLTALAAASYAVCDKAILQMALLVLCAAEKGQDWNPNFRKDITCAIDGLRAMLARINGEAG